MLVDASEKTRRGKKISPCKMAFGKMCEIDSMPCRMAVDTYCDEELNNECLCCKDFFNYECTNDTQCEALNEAALRC